MSAFYCYQHPLTRTTTITKNPSLLATQQHKPKCLPKSFTQSHAVPHHSSRPPSTPRHGSHISSSLLLCRWRHNSHTLYHRNKPRTTTSAHQLHHLVLSTLVDERTWWAVAGLTVAVKMERAQSRTLTRHLTLTTSTCVVGVRLYDLLCLVDISILGQVTQQKEFFLVSILAVKPGMGIKVLCVASLSERFLFGIRETWRLFSRTEMGCMISLVVRFPQICILRETVDVCHIIVWSIGQDNGWRWSHTNMSALILNCDCFES